jgi:anti-anti-sigma factor
VVTVRKSGAVPKPVAGLRARGQGEYGEAMGVAVVTIRRQADGVLVIEVRGSLDAATVDALRTAILGTLQRERPVTLIVDLTFVVFMDSLGIGTLVSGHRAAREVGTRFLLRNPSEFVHRQLRVTGLTEMFGLPSVWSGAVAGWSDAPSSSTR